jgi:DNA mismatch repair ATPase MutL
MDNIDDFLNELYENWIDLVIDNVPLVSNFNSYQNQQSQNQQSQNQQSQNRESQNQQSQNRESQNRESQNQQSQNQQSQNRESQNQENVVNSNLFGMLDLLRNAHNTNTNSNTNVNTNVNINLNENINWIDVIHNSNRQIINDFMLLRNTGEIYLQNRLDSIRNEYERQINELESEQEPELESESQFFEMPSRNINFERRNDGRYPLNNDISNLVGDLFSNIFDYINEPEMEDVKVTISKNDFEELKTIMLTNENIKEYEDKSCIVCLEQYKVKDKLKILSCEHIFHENCIYQWLCKEKISCPICRKDIRKNE